jgi:predicted dehydrogenase
VGKPLGVGVVGVGNISGQYFENIPKLANLKLIGVADLDVERAKKVAAAQGVQAFTVQEIYTAPNVDVILNLTLPQSHAEVTLKALQNGKHVYLEKPFALTMEEARPVIEYAASNNLRIGCAPDTFLGTGIQTSKYLLDNGAIGGAFAASAAWSAPGHERWHPSPQFYYLNGAGPLFDMGPYYLTALVTLLGPVVNVIGNTTRSNRERKIHTGDLAGTRIAVEVDTHISAILTHASGAQSTIMVSFEIWGSKLPTIEIYGTKGTISVPDPNRFSDPTFLFTEEEPEWKEVKPLAGYVDAGRGFGLSDMATAMEENRQHRASGELGLHVLEIMEAILKSGNGSARELIKSKVQPSSLVLLAQPTIAD